MAILTMVGRLCQFRDGNAAISWRNARPRSCRWRYFFSDAAPRVLASSLKIGLPFLVVTGVTYRRRRRGGHAVTELAYALGGAIIGIIAGRIIASVFAKAKIKASAQPYYPLADI